MPNFESIIRITEEEVDAYQQQTFNRDADWLLIEGARRYNLDHFGWYFKRFPLPDDCKVLSFGTTNLYHVGNWKDDPIISLETQIQSYLKPRVKVVFDSIQSEIDIVIPITVMSEDGKIYFNDSSIDEYKPKDRNMDRLEKYINGLQEQFPDTNNPIHDVLKNIFPGA